MVQCLQGKDQLLFSPPCSTALLSPLLGPAATAANMHRKQHSYLTISRTSLKKKIKKSQSRYMETAIKFLDTFLLASNVVSQLPRSCWGMSASQDRSTVITLNGLSSVLCRWPQFNSHQQHWALAPSSGAHCSQNIQFPFLTNGG